MNPKIYKWTARILGTLIAGFWLLMFIGYAIGGDPYADPSQAHEGYGVAILGGILIAGVIVAWFKPKIGAYILIPVSIIFGIFAYFTAGSNQHMAILVSGVPYLVVGILFLKS